MSSHTRASNQQQARSIALKTKTIAVLVEFEVRREASHRLQVRVSDSKAKHKLHLGGIARVLTKEQLSDELNKIVKGARVLPSSIMTPRRQWRLILAVLGI